VVVARPEALVAAERDRGGLTERRARRRAGMVGPAHGRAAERSRLEAHPPGPAAVVRATSVAAGPMRTGIALEAAVGPGPLALGHRGRSAHRRLAKSPDLAPAGPTKGAPHQQGARQGARALGAPAG
jgi:hypothetical protein